MKKKSKQPVRMRLYENMVISLLITTLLLPAILQSNVQQSNALNKQSATEPAPEQEAAKGGGQVKKMCLHTGTENYDIRTQVYFNGEFY